MTVNQLLNKAKALLKANNIDNYDVEAYFMVEHVLSLSRTELLFSYNREVTAKEEAALDEILSKRNSGEPLQYCIGEWDFFGEKFFVGEGVLIPRPETEELCNYVIEKIKHIRSPKIFDLCAGSGCIGISIKNNVPKADVTLIELSDKAFHFLKKNASKFETDGGVTLLKGDILRPESCFETIEEKADAIVSNPPYIKREDIESLQAEVKHEPVMALDGGEDGFDFYRVICKKWPEYLKDGGFIALECGEEQAQYICELFDKELFDTEIIKDFASVDRFVIGRKKVR